MVFTPLDCDKTYIGQNRKAIERELRKSEKAVAKRLLEDNHKMRLHEK